MLHIYLVALVLSVPTIAVSSCGSSSKAKPASTQSAAATTATAEPGQPLTQAALIARADPICARVKVKLASTQPRQTPQEIAKFASEVAEEEKSAAAELSQLVPPPSMASDWKQIIAGTKGVADDVATLGERAKSNQLRGKAAHKLITKRSETEQRVLIIAQRDGFKDCASSV